jgi:hypothetical protein
MVEGRSIFGSGAVPPLLHVLAFERSMEIDTCFDFELAQLIYAKRHDGDLFGIGD